MKAPVACLLVALGLACGSDEETTARGSGHAGGGHGAGHGGRGMGHGGRAEHGGAPRPEPLARVARLGDGRPGPLRPGQTLDATATLSTGAERLVLDLREGARVELEPGSLARLGEEAPAELLLARGHVHAVLPPVGNSPRPPLRIGTPAGTVEIGGSGDLWITVRSDGTAWVALLGGRASVLTGETDEATGTERRLDLTPARAVVVGRTLEEPTEGPTTLAAARAMGVALAEGAEEAELEDALAAAVGALDAALDTLAAERQRGQEVQRRHRAAVSAMDPRAATIMQELVAHGRALDAARDLLLTRFERARAIALLASGEGGDPTAVRRPRVRAALGLD